MKNRTIHKIHDMYNNNFNYLRLFINTTYEAIDNYQNLLLSLVEPVNRASNLNTEEQYAGIQTKGDRFLSEVYSLSRVDNSKEFNMYTIGETLGFDELDTENIVNNLSRAELIKHDSVANQVSITPYGMMIKRGEINVGYAPVH
ncbi:hypothetical protein MYX76_02525 [Desulfobacterota bacterium AH_259_B03_O07]|nr:hypothetical protein [Desulfobacterota bacterium AH_259_B03_O07]